MPCGSGPCIACILSDPCIWVSFLWKVGNDVVYLGSVLIRNSLGQADKCKAGKHSQVP